MGMSELMAQLFPSFSSGPSRADLQARVQRAELSNTEKRRSFREALAEVDKRANGHSLEDLKADIDTNDAAMREALGGE